MRGAFFTASVLAAASSFAYASDVLDLHQSDFAATVQPEKLILVEFFAPWCGHCKALAPHYEEAATILKNQSIKLAKVDCTAETELCSSHGIQGYPTLKVFRNGEAGEYGGSRKTDGIVSYMKKQALPAVSEITASNHAEFSKADKIVLIAYLEASDSTNKQVFSDYAESHRDDYLFGVSTDSSVFSTAGVQPPALVLYKDFDEGRNDFTGSFTSLGLAEFTKAHSTPLLDEITPENFASYAEAGIPLAYIFIEAENVKRDLIVKSIEPVAREVKGKINFVWIDATKFADHAKSLNLVDAKWPSFAIQNVAEMTKYPMDQSSSVDAHTVKDFVDRFLKGEIKPSIKSEPIPATQDEGVYVLVADEFEKVTADNTKDMLVEFYAPWCGHCKKLAPTWDTLGEKYTNSKDKILIGKFDAHNNDVPATSGIKIAGFPTIKFKAAGTDNWVDYEGDRSLESFMEYIDQNSVNEVSPNEAADGNSTADQIVFGDSDDSHDDASHHDEL